MYSLMCACSRANKTSNIACNLTLPYLSFEQMFNNLSGLVTDPCVSAQLPLKADIAM